MLTDLLTSPAALVPVVFAFVILYFTLPRNAKGSDAPPMAKGAIKIPLIGRIIEFGKGPLVMVERCYKEYGPVFTIPVSASTMIAVNAMPSGFFELCFSLEESIIFCLHMNSNQCV
jgi:hypothetical protein